MHLHCTHSDTRTCTLAFASPCPLGPNPDFSVIIRHGTSLIVEKGGLSLNLLVPHILFIHWKNNWLFISCDRQMLLGSVWLWIWVGHICVEWWGYGHIRLAILNSLILFGEFHYHHVLVSSPWAMVLLVANGTLVTHAWTCWMKFPVIFKWRQHRQINQRSILLWSVQPSKALPS
jgi:hypothetical protein